MLEIVKQVIDFYLSNNREPTLSDLNISDETLLNRRWSIFVTIFNKWVVRWSAWNIKELELNIVLELIKSSVAAIKDDSRFSPLSLSESKNIKIRVDEITSRDMLDKPSDIKNLDPIKNGIIVINKDYDSLWVILPNISPLLMTWEDMIWVMEKKLWSKIWELDKIYSIETNILTTY